MAGSRHGSGSGSSSRGDGAAVLRPAIVLPMPNVVDPIYVGDKTRNSSGDTCGYYKPQGGSQCRQPRSCYDCLNAHLAGVEGGCVLSPTGACQPIGAYLASRDYRANHSSTPVSAAYNNYFPSINTTYCEPTDAACDRCRKIALTDVISSSASMITLGQWNGSHEIAQRFCLGAKDCVCLAACTPEKWKNNVQEDCSPANSNGTANAETTPETYRSMLPIFMALQFLLILMVIHRQRLYANRFRRATRPEGPYNNPRAISSPSQRLQLTGWRAMQQDLVNREKARHGLVSLMSPRDNNTLLQQTQQSQPPSQPEGEVQPEAQQPQPQPRPSQSHNYVLYEPEDEDIPEMPPGSPMTPMAAPRRRASTDASVAMLEDGRTSESATNTQQRAPAVSNIEEGREAKSH